MSVKTKTTRVLVSISEQDLKAIDRKAKGNRSAYLVSAALAAADPIRLTDEAKEAIAKVKPNNPSDWISAACVAYQKHIEAKQRNEALYSARKSVFGGME